MSLLAAKRWVAALLVIAALGAGKVALATRPTPHEQLDGVLTPVREAETQLQLTDAERAEVAELFSRAETHAAAVVEARRRGETARAESHVRRIQTLSRLLRSRVEALRAEVRAENAERSLLQAEDRRTRARAQLERAAERQLELQRQQAEPAAPATTTADAGVAAEGGAR